MTTDAADRPEVLLMTPRVPFLREPLEREYRVHHYWEAADPAGFLQGVGPRVRAVVTNGVVGCPAEVIDALPHLGLIAVGGVGLDAVDVPRAHARGVQVTTTPGVLTADVADTALALLLAASRQVIAADRLVRSGDWGAGHDVPLTTRVSGRKAGIVGLGQIGKAIARRLSAMDMEVSYTGRRAQPDQPYAFVPDVLDLAREVDVLVVAAAASEQTRGLIDARVLGALGEGGILVNIARGSLVNEEDLIRALREGTIAAAGLDVFEHEPHVPEALRALDNVVLSPHAGTRTVQSRMDMSRVVLDNLRAFFAGRPLFGAVGAG